MVIIRNFQINIESKKMNLKLSNVESVGISQPLHDQVSKATCHSLGAIWRGFESRKQQTFGLPSEINRKPSFPNLRTVFKLGQTYRRHSLSGYKCKKYTHIYYSQIVKTLCILDFSCTKVTIWDLTWSKFMLKPPAFRLALSSQNGVQAKNIGNSAGEFRLLKDLKLSFSSISTCFTVLYRN